MYIDVFFFLVCFICIGVRIVSNACSGFCCLSLVVQIGARPVVPLVAKGSTERLQRLRFREEIQDLHLNQWSKFDGPIFFL